MASCSHHPDYDPASGEPRIRQHDPSDYDEKEPTRGDVNCKDCWQARAKWVDNADHQVRKQLIKRIAELEQDLAEATSVLKYTSTTMVEAEKREAVLREALEEIAKSGPNVRGSLLQVRARAALEVK